MKTLFLTLTLIFVFVISNTYSQKLPFKFGKVSMDEMQMTKCDFYPEARSMVLGTYSDLHFLYDNNDGWKYEQSVTIRKKIFKITDGDQANVKIELYQPSKGSAKEEIFSLKSYTYNIVEGEIDRKKLDNKEYFTKRINDYWVEVSFAIPGVKDGSIIEYTYTKTSDYLYNLSTWYFQLDIPVAHSEFKVVIPEYFNYQTSQVGNTYIGDHQAKIKPEKFTYRWESRESFGNVRKGTGTLESNSKQQQFIIKNIPPVEDEPFMNNKLDAPCRLEFQLMSTLFPNGTLKVIAGDYQKFNGELLTSAAFGDRLKNGGFVKFLEDSLQNKEVLQRSQFIYRHISNHFDWNRSYTFMSSNAGRPAYNKKQGSIADINLSLVAALRAYDIKAYPVLLSTRGHGTVHPVYPSYEDYNYVVAAIQIDDKLIMCDAVSRLPFGQLPIKCRNGQGWLVNEQGGYWVDLKAGSNYQEITMLKTEFKEGKLTTHVEQRESGYAAHDIVKQIKKGSTKDYTQTVSSRYSDAEVKNFQISNTDLRQPVQLEYDIIREGDESDMFYIQPIVTGSIISCPFKREKRTSHIDFPYSQSRRVISQIKIPQGYSVELPESVIYKLPSGQGSFVFNVQQVGDLVNVVSNLMIKQTIFTTDDYAGLKRFYEMVSDKNQELIVLSK